MRKQIITISNVKMEFLPTVTVLVFATFSSGNAHFDNGLQEPPACSRYVYIISVFIKNLYIYIFRGNYNLQSLRIGFENLMSVDIYEYSCIVRFWRRRCLIFMRGGQNVTTR